MRIEMENEIALAVRGLLATGDCRLRKHRATFIDRDCRWFNGWSTPAFITSIGPVHSNGCL